MGAPIAGRQLPVLLITGVAGAGKSTVTAEASWLLHQAGIPHAVADLAVIGTCWPAPPDDRWNEELIHCNLAACGPTSSGQEPAGYWCAASLRHAACSPGSPRRCPSDGLGDRQCPHGPPPRVGAAGSAARGPRTRPARRRCRRRGGRSPVRLRSLLVTAGDHARHYHAHDGPDDHAGPSGHHDGCPPDVAGHACSPAIQVWVTRVPGANGSPSQTTKSAGSPAASPPAGAPRELAAATV
jgi:hypothetical protein